MRRRQRPAGADHLKLHSHRPRLAWTAVAGGAAAVIVIAAVILPAAPSLAIRLAAVHHVPDWTERERALLHRERGEQPGR